MPKWILGQILGGSESLASGQVLGVGVNMRSEMSASNQFRCLVADDVRTARQVLSRCLTEAGFTVTLVGDGSDAWEHLQRESFDLLITDIEMPKMTGLELLRNLRCPGGSGFSVMPAIVTTSLQDQKLVETVLAFGATTVFSKPLDRTSLTRVVQQLCDGEPVLTTYRSEESALGGGSAGISASFRRIVDRAKS